MICIGILILTAISPIADSTAVSSSNASYDGNSLVLKGNVLLDHGLGKMKAEEAILEKQEVGKEFPFSFVRLRKAVLLTLAQDATLSCDAADLDFTALKGHLISEERVRYTDSLKRKKGPKTLFCLTSKTADLDLSKQEEETEKPHYAIASIFAQDSVQFEYDQKYTLHADTALFRKIHNHLSARAQKEGPRCKLTYESNAIEADTIDLDLTISELAMLYPEGTLPSLLSQAETRFSANSLLWNHQTNILTLKKNVHLNDPSLGTILAEEEMQLAQIDQQLSSIRTQGKTIINYLNAHKLTCFGTIDLNQKKLQAVITSPLTHGETPSNAQLSYEEEQATVFADTGHIEYTLSNNTFQPISISLKGHVRLFSHDADKPVSYGITDRLTYSPTTRTFILNADPGKKVLFINAEENIRLSAQEIHVTEDPSTKKQMVKGIGNVQLTLTAEEETLMQQFFPQSTL